MLPICFSNQHVAKSTHLSTIDTMDLCVYVGAECPIWASTLRTRRWDMVGFAKLLSCLFWNFGCGRNRWWLIAMTRPLWLVSLGILCEILWDISQVISSISGYLWATSYPISPSEAKAAVIGANRSSLKRYFMPGWTKRRSKGVF